MSIPVDPKRNIKAKTVTDLMEKEFSDPGDSEGHPKGGFLTFACPGCGKVGGIMVGHPKPEPSPSWDIQSGDLKNPETLTLSPSINCIGCCKWHGYLRNGKYESC